MKRWQTQFKVLAVSALVAAQLLLGSDKASEKITLANGLEVTVRSDGEMRVMQYPKQWNASLEVLQVPLNAIVEEITPSSCEDLSNRLKGGGETSPPNPFLADGIRRRHPILVRLDILSQMKEKQIIEDVKSTLIEQNLPVPNHLNLENPIEFSNLQIQVKRASDSMSAMIGKVEEQNQKVAALINEGIGQVGFSNGEITSIDFLCDLLNKKVSLQIGVQGSELNTPRYRALMPVEESMGLQDFLMSYRAKYKATLDRGAFSFNRTLTGLLIGEYLASRKITLPLEDKLLLIERMTDSDTGIPVSVSGIEMKQRLQVVISDQTPFQGQADVEFTGGSR